MDLATKDQTPAVQEVRVEIQICVLAVLEALADKAWAAQVRVGWAVQVATRTSVQADPVGKAWVAQEDKVWAVQVDRVAWVVQVVPAATLTSALAALVVQAAIQLDRVAIRTYARAVPAECHRVDSRREEILTFVQAVQQVVQVGTPATCSEIHSNKRNEATSEKERQEAAINLSLFILSEIR